MTIPIQKMKATTVAAVLAVLVSAAAGDGCPSEGVFNENLDKCYIFLKESATFEVAQQTCAGYGGYLVSIRNAFENAFVAGQAEEHFGAEDYWIGLTDPLNDGNWEWPDGSKATYTNWATGFPMKSNVVSLSCVASLAGKGKWYNTLCDDKQPNLLCELPACPGWSSATGRCDNGVCPTGYGCTSSNVCCPAPLASCTGKYKAGLCTANICPLGFSCDTTDLTCCPSATNIGSCINLPGTAATCPEGYTCYPVDDYGGVVDDSMCYQVCNGVGTSIGPPTGSTCPQGYWNILDQCCDAF